jgi:hypothetical protein
VFQGASRIALGALFGFVFVCCVKAEFLFGTTLLSKPYGVFAVSILAGFSETFVPEFLQRLDTQATKSASQATLSARAQPQRNSAPSAPTKCRPVASKNRNRARNHKISR